MRDPDAKFRSLSPEDLRCVWMTAGVLSYQLCDRAFECDDCPLDAAMRGHCADRAAGPGKGAGRSAPQIRRGELRDDCRYSRNHCWMRQMNLNVLRVGMEPGLSSTLQDPRGVVLPARGQSLRRGETCLWIVTDGGTFAVVSPVTGFVATSNENLVDNPHLVCTEPFERGWLFEVEWTSSGTEASAMLGSHEASARFARDEAAFLSSLSEALGDRPARVGATLADGGEFIQDVSRMLGPARYFKLLRRAFGQS